MEHYGQHVEYIVRRKGYSITDLAIGLNVNRRSIYNYFQNKYLKYDIIYNIGLVIGHDFSQEFPDHFTSEQFNFKINPRMVIETTVKQNNTGDHWQDKYIKLLETYSKDLEERLLVEGSMQ